jgi:hypothetical protein
MVISQKEMPCVFFLSPPFVPFSCACRDGVSGGIVRTSRHFNYHCLTTAVALCLSKRRTLKL